jgi:pectin methylesterase-like acyl-CoA thioesterase
VKHTALIVAIIVVCIIVTTAAYYNNTTQPSNLPTPGLPSPIIQQSTPSPTVPNPSPTVSVTNTPNPTSVPTTTSSPSLTQTPSQTPTPTPTPKPEENNTQTISVGNLGQYKTIQAGLDAVINEASIKISTGVYPENLVMSGSKRVVLQGGWDENFVSRTNDSSLTVIDGTSSDSVLTIQSTAGQSLNVTIEDLEPLRLGLVQI